MENINHYELINFLEWIKTKEQSEGGYSLDFVKEIIGLSKQNQKNLFKLKLVIDEYIEEKDKDIKSTTLLDEVLSWYYNNGKTSCCAEVETEESKALSNKPSLEIMIEKKNKLKIDRYNNSNIFKCIIFPFNNDSILKDLVKKYYAILNTESANYLDIFYSKKELKKSGYDVRAELSQLNIPVDTVPCIAVWKNNIKSAVLIPISGINEDGLFQLLLHIIHLIKTNPSLQNRYLRKCCVGKVDEIKRNNEYRKSQKEPIYKKLLWNIVFPVCCSVVSSIIAGVIVFLITKT